ncbi:MAG: prepilin-type N-terminal cleavage/methylation domain-containing protein [Campylobacteraceae bacterium]|jgi:prepilin-type N-terminal cleavage/methylation domain-containing protein|nr:prepilin-type N-terminal cleavage/methylation domain-containing protein [Campylobacteraceae bacterium]
MKRAFTLIEVVISIAIFSIIAIYMYQAIDTMRKSNDINSLRYNEDIKEQKTLKLFYNDLFLQTNLYATSNITNSDEFDIFRLHTKNSIHGMINPYVTYFIKDNSLFRIESREFEIIPLTYESVERVRVDKLMENITLFRIYENRNSYIISYKSNERLALFQISLPQVGASNNTSSRGNQSI